MIHIKYTIQNSDTHGIGLFADQNIYKNDLIYTPNPLLDVNITQKQFHDLSESEQNEVMYYGYFNNKTKKWHVAFDAIRVLNHGDIPNVSQNEDMVMIAIQDIKKGEELLQDYSEVYPIDGEHFMRIRSHN